MVEKYLIAQPLVMVAVFVAVVGASLLYEIVSFLRAKPEQAAVPVVVKDQTLRKRKV